MKSLKISILVFASMVAACFMGTGKVQAQEFTIQGDLVSSYVWRGFYQTGVSFQPTLGFGVGDFSLTAWGSTDFDGVSSGEGAAAKEIDLTAAYALGESGLTFSVASLWWGGQGARKYFNFKCRQTKCRLNCTDTVNSKVVIRTACIHGKASVRIYLSGFYRHTF